MSYLDIANQALGRLGEPPIGSLEESSKAAKLIFVAIYNVRDYVLRVHPWNFALGRVCLLYTSPSPRDS